MHAFAEFINPMTLKQQIFSIESYKACPGQRMEFILSFMPTDTGFITSEGADHWIFIILLLLRSYDRYMCD